MEYRIPAFVISLARATEHRADITARLKQAGVEFEIVDAVDGEDLDMSSIKPRLVFDWAKLRGQATMTPPQIGCFLSHYNLWARMIDEQIPFALILEEDSMWDDDFFAVAQAVVASKYYWNIVHMSHPDLGKMEEIIDRVGALQLVRFRYAQCCTDAYLIDLDGAKKMHKFCHQIRDNIDQQWRFYWKSDCYFYHVTPAPARQNQSPTQIPNPNSGCRRRGWQVVGWRKYLRHKIQMKLDRKRFNQTHPRKLR